MSSIVDEDGDLNWRRVVDLLGNGQTVEIPCQDEGDYTRRATQATRRAERQGIAVETTRGDGVLLVQPRGRTERVANEEDLEAEASATREARRAERARRQAQRAERGTGSGDEG
jgi:hypothetical protein